ncbi:hypothetical protein CPB85DRAFT_1376903 [Mucidula mucida]|nr:hypothetical protein CPB85DRAFT_1376903 [Mucidula mucida]
MHLIWENLIKNLILLWTGEFKGLDTGDGDYVLPKTVWEAIGEATAAAGSTIPSAYGSCVPNISKDRTTVSAEMWSFWTLYIGPVLLRNKFSQQKYYDHFVRLVSLLTICLKFEISHAEIETVRVGFEQWVTDYESFYYQHNPVRIAVCPVTVHALLHIADSIRDMGPVWCYWAFPMERYCGQLSPYIPSRRRPFRSLDRYVTESTQLTQLMVIYNLFNLLNLRPLWKQVEGTFSTPLFTKRVTNSVCAALATRFSTATKKVKVQTIRPHLQLVHIRQWGRVRRIDSDAGDTIRAVLTSTTTDDSRDATFVRYEVYVDRNARDINAAEVLDGTTLYGQLERLITIQLPDAAFAGGARALAKPSDRVIIFAAIRQCVVGPETIHGLDFHFYEKLGGLDIVDITSVQALVGRVKEMAPKKGYALIDRSGSLARAVYEDEDDHARRTALNAEESAS